MFEMDFKHDYDLINAKFNKEFDYSTKQSFSLAVAIIQFLINNKIV